MLCRGVGPDAGVSADEKARDHMTKPFEVLVIGSGPIIIGQAVEKCISLSAFGDGEEVDIQGWEKWLGLAI